MAETENKEIPDKPSIVVCGDTFNIPANKDLTVGPGLVFRNNAITCTKPGVIKSNEKSVWIDRNNRRYVPVLEERVVGIIIGRVMDEYRIDIGGAHVAMMSSIAFEGATQRNKPELKPGNVVFARVIAANKDVEPELACVNKKGKANGLQVLEGGHIIQCSLGLCRKLRQHKSPLTQPLLNHFKSFELCVGMNGRIWVRSDTNKHTVAISMYLKQCEHLSVADAVMSLRHTVKALG